jgi:hypothetical protein
MIPSDREIKIQHLRKYLSDVRRHEGDIRREIEPVLVEAIEGHEAWLRVEKMEESTV